MYKMSIMLLSLFVAGCVTTTQVTNVNSQPTYDHGWFTLTIGEPSLSSNVNCEPIFKGKVLNCVFENTYGLSNMFGYASYHVEMGYNMQQIRIKKREKRSLPLKGTNLSVVALDDYITKSKKHGIALTEGEKLLDTLLSTSDYEYIIASPKSGTQTTKHELFHALFFVDSIYRNSVNDFWETVVTERDKNSIKNIFIGSYDISNEYMVVDEFQAHLLYSSGNMLGRYQDKYRAAFLSYIEKNVSEESLQRVRTIGWE